MSDNSSQPIHTDRGGDVDHDEAVVVDNISGRSGGAGGGGGLIVEFVRDVYQWRRKWASLVVLVVATALWVALQVYYFNFITLASWLAMLTVISAFIWGNICRLFGKEAPSMSGLGIPEELVVEMANSLREVGKEGVRWMFRVGAEGDWFVFAGTVVGLWLLSVAGTFFDLPTALYIGTLVGMTVPVSYEKYEHKINEYCARLRELCRRFYHMIDDKVLRKIKDKMMGVHQTKEHKTE